MINSQVKLSERSLKQQLVTTNTQHSNIVNKTHILVQGSAQAYLKFPGSGEGRRMAKLSEEQVSHAK